MTARQLRTACTRDCPDTCSLLVTLDAAGEIVSVEGDPAHPITRGFTCPRGARDHIRLLTNRLERPHVRLADQLEPTDWASSLDLADSKLRQTLEDHGPEAVLFLNYAGNMGLLTEVFPQRLWKAIGATQTDWAICSVSGHVGLGLHHGASYGVLPSELHAADLIVFWGMNAAASTIHMWSLARQARQESGTQIVVVDPRRSESARSADLWIQPRPGSDVALAYAVIEHLVRNDQVDLSFIEQRTTGFEELQLAASQWTPERAEAVTGLPRG